MQSSSSNSGDVSELLTILIVLVGLGVVLILIVTIMVWKNQCRHCPRSSCTDTCRAKNKCFRDVEECRSLGMCDTFQTVLCSDLEMAYSTSGNGVTISRNNTEIFLIENSDCQEIAYINADSGVDNCYENGADTGDLESLPLSQLPPTIENVLIKTLDVPHNGEYGWKRVGKAFGINKIDLRYLKTGYKRRMESPTKELLEMLDSQCRTVGDLLTKLKGSDVNQPAVARLICQKWQEVKYAQARK